MHAHSTHALTHTHTRTDLTMVEQASSWTDCPVPRSLWLHAFYVVSILWGAEERSGKLPHRLKLSSSFMEKKNQNFRQKFDKANG